MTNSLSMSEIMVIAVVILIVFGPDRLPEMARRAGEMIARFRDAANTLKTELTQEYEEVAKPLQDIQKELRAAKDDLRSAGDEVKSAMPDLNELEATPDLEVTPDPPAVEDGDSPTEGGDPGE